MKKHWNLEQNERNLKKPWVAHAGTLQSPLRSPGQVRVDDWHIHLSQQEIFAMECNGNVHTPSAVSLMVPYDFVRIQHDRASDLIE